MTPTIGFSSALRDFRYLTGSLLRSAELLRLRLTQPSREQFDCPVCLYHGVFLDYRLMAGAPIRKHALCPRCESLERHRLQWLVLQSLPEKNCFAEMDVLHIAPEKCFERRFRSIFRSYTSADLIRGGVDMRLDLCDMAQVRDRSFDLVWASHVLEHIVDDRTAVANISRVLRPGGLAILPVPIVAEQTLQYPYADPRDNYHVRAPGPDYYHLYRSFFRSVDIFDSGSFSESFQTLIYEDRATRQTNFRPPMVGTRHMDYVPVCRK